MDFPARVPARDRHNESVIRAQSHTSQDQQWQIPVHMRVTAGGKVNTSRILLTDKETTVPLPREWESILLNEGGHGFYRVRYAPDLLNRLLHGGIDRLA